MTGPGASSFFRGRGSSVISVGLPSAVSGKFCLCIPRKTMDGDPIEDPVEGVNGLGGAAPTAGGGDTRAPSWYSRLGKRRRARSRDDRDELERRLAALAEDVREQSAEALRKKRAESTLEARMHVEGIAPVHSNAPMLMEGGKVKLAIGVDPKQDPTVLGRRTERGTYEFALPGEMAGEVPAPKRRRRLGMVFAVAIVVAIAWWVQQARRPPVKMAASLGLTVLPILQVKEPERPAIDREILELAARVGAQMPPVESASAPQGTATTTNGAPQGTGKKRTGKDGLPPGAEPEY
jgi:hypothetical protein